MPSVREPSQCVWCGAPGVTKEHIIGAAQTEYFGPVSGEPDIHHWYQAGPDAPIEHRKSAARFAMFARKACRSCNNGWMRTLDDRLEPVLRAFARKRAVRIDLPTQQNLARWALKISLLTMTQDPDETQFAPRDHYRHVYETDAPPDGYQLWLGQTNAVELVSAQSHSLVGDDVVAPGYASIVTYGHGLVYIVRHGSHRLMKLRRDPDIRLAPLWPPVRPIAWPRFRGIPSAQLPELTPWVMENVILVEPPAP